MNRKEFCELNKYCAYHYKVKKMLKQWKSDNHITERCIIHHRDDNDEVRTYNEAHYELWGFEINENGEEHFEYGKYIKFMTASEHTKYHSTGRQFSESHRDNLSKALHNHFSNTRSHMYGQHHTDDTKAKMSDKVKEALRLESNIYANYKANGGTLKWQAFRTALKNGTLKIDKEIYNDNNT